VAHAPRDSVDRRARDRAEGCDGAAGAPSVPAVGRDTRFVGQYAAYEAFGKRESSKVARMTGNTAV